MLIKIVDLNDCTRMSLWFKDGGFPTIAHSLAE
jgi:hypothetical protein